MYIKYLWNDMQERNNVIAYGKDRAAGRKRWEEKDLYI